MSRFISLITLISALMVVSACSSEKQPARILAETESSSSGVFNDVVQNTERKETRFLAYQHSILAEAEPEVVGELHSRIVEGCIRDQQFQCVILHSRLSGTPYPFARIQMRLLPAGVRGFNELISTGGKIVSTTTSADDLTDQITDNKKRLDMLQKHLFRLEQLHERDAGSIEELLLVAKELASVQTEIEFARGREASLQKRVDQDLLTIEVSSLSSNSTGSSIRAAFGSFKDDLIHAFADVISFVAWLIPWLPVIVIFIWLLRVTWRFLRRSRG